MANSEEDIHPTTLALVVEDTKIALITHFDEEHSAYQWINYWSSTLVNHLKNLGSKVGGKGGGSGDPKVLSLTQWWERACRELEKQGMCIVTPEAESSYRKFFTCKWSDEPIIPSARRFAHYKLKK